MKICNCVVKYCNQLAETYFLQIVDLKKSPVNNFDKGPIASTLKYSDFTQICKILTTLGRLKWENQFGFLFSTNMEC